MAKTFHLEIIATDRIFFSGEVEHLVITAIDGLLGIMAGHEPLVTSLPTGELKYLVDGVWKYAAISEGFIQVMPDSSIILADTCELPEEIDIKRAQEAKERAEERLRQKQSIKEYYETQAALNRAMNRLKLSQKHFK
ncbi:MAG: F0F1 ATP synthase subunit epsilon [Ruminococcus sp.]|jgi:F-type H+-transporting ATPase subunit epsilon|uniref:F0F1 ATP synthase subunit epsilon n=1 Tax=Ruminococcus sp. TaxID=41978 RepID=UPI001B1135BB|nr:F0F1 ATP synthase subunit epsilon [Ruminococcus sp.]MBO4492932.1 F0F1 ATP synthase subunit epsilon [Ruminococcus sp.]MBO7473282.1 F0F1 ATP synthase subunit epsilon [Ruminococcus sp.]MBP5433959.1 F0F1 ATP synthase subunit epsilon [Ruminococcus sp.]MBP5579302.1 F0F1 ATP synthase subunit epsilon [Ruminococcus sp.]